MGDKLSKSNNNPKPSFKEQFDELMTDVVILLRILFSLAGALFVYAITRTYDNQTDSFAIWVLNAVALCFLLSILLCLVVIIRRSWNEIKLIWALGRNETETGSPSQTTPTTTFTSEATRNQNEDVSSVHLSLPKGKE